MHVISRKEARAAGLTHYFTGKPCNRGGIAPRAVADKHCQCEAHREHRNARARDYGRSHLYENRKRAAQWQQANPNRARSKKRSWYEENKDKALANSQSWYRENRGRHYECHKAWKEKNPDMSRVYLSRWKARNPDKRMADCSLRRAAKINATPSWYGEFDRMVMREAHDAAQSRSRTTGIDWEVDHIIPLRAKLACGLHTAANIQVIPAAMNRRKNNRIQPEVCL